MASDVEELGSVTIRPVKLSWIKGSVDDPADLCAHAHVELRIDDELLIDPERDGEVTASAAALYLLRTLEREHTAGSRVGDHLFPCCGFALYDEAGSPDVSIVGCPNGIDLEVHHGSGRENVAVRTQDGRERAITWADWQRAVFAFADAVSDFFASASPKTPSAEDEPGFRKFIAEWERRRGRRFGMRPSRV